MLREALVIYCGGHGDSEKHFMQCAIRKTLIAAIELLMLTQIVEKSMDVS